MRPIHPDILKGQNRTLGAPTNADRDRRRAADLRYRTPLIVDPSDYPVFRDSAELPPGFQRGGTGAETLTPVSSTGYARYIGRAIPHLEEVTILWRVTTLGAAATYAEWGLAWSSEPVSLGAGLDTNYLNTIGWTDVAGDVTSTGLKRTIITDFAEVNVGLDLWAVFVHQGSTGLVLRGGLPNEAGFLLSKAGSARPSVLAADAPFTEVSTATNDLWFAVQQVGA